MSSAVSLRGSMQMSFNDSRSGNITVAMSEKPLPGYARRNVTLCLSATVTTVSTMAVLRMPSSGVIHGPPDT